MKRSNEIEAEIQRLEQELVSLDAQLDKKIKDFAFRELPHAAATWMEAETKRRIEANAERIGEIGVEKLRELKSELSSLIERLPKLAEEAIADNQRWPHREKKNRDSVKSSSSGVNFFQNTFRAVINNLGALLAKYDLIKEKNGFAASWEKSSANGFRYAFNPGFDPRQYRILMEYESVLKEQRQKVGELAQKQQELMKAKAGELWDSI